MGQRPMISKLISIYSSEISPEWEILHYPSLHLRGEYETPTSYNVMSLDVVLYLSSLEPEGW